MTCWLYLDLTDMFITKMCRRFRRRVTRAITSYGHKGCDATNLASSASPVLLSLLMGIVVVVVVVVAIVVWHICGRHSARRSTEVTCGRARPSAPTLGLPPSLGPKLRPQPPPYLLFGWGAPTLPFGWGAPTLPSAVAALHCSPRQDRLVLFAAVGIDTWQESAIE